MKHCFTFLVILLTSILHAQAPELAWAKKIGNNNTSGMHGPVMAVDEDGNSYISGIFFNSNFNMEGISLTNPAQSTFSTGGYIAKYDANGQILWAKPMGNILTTVSGSFRNPDKLITDSGGNLYVCGQYYSGEYSEINGHVLPQNSINNKRDYFLAKLDPQGNVLWSRTTFYPDPPYTVRLAILLNNEIRFDPGGNVLMTGAFSEYLALSPSDTLYNGQDEVSVFMARYSPQGQLLDYQKLAGSYPADRYQGEQVEADAYGNLYRWSTQTAPFPKVLYRYDLQGQLLDSDTLAISTSHQYDGYFTMNAFEVTPLGDILIGGLWLGSTLTVEGNSYPGAPNNGNSGAVSADAFVCKFAAPNYQVDWVHTLTSIRSERFEHLLSDGLGNVYAAGWKDAGQYGKLLLHKLSPTGQPLWEREIGPQVDAAHPDLGEIRRLTGLGQPYHGGNIWISGNFEANMYFSDDYHFSIPEQTNGVHYNAFLAEYGTCATALPEVYGDSQRSLCEGESLVLSADFADPALDYFWNTGQTTSSITVTQPGTYYVIAQEDAECYGQSRNIRVGLEALPNPEVQEEANVLTAVEDAPGTSYQWR